jgi:hypothetical protein
MKKFNYLAVVFFFGVIFSFLSPIKAYAADAVVAGKAKVANTLSYLDFNASPYNSNVTIDTASGDFSGYGWSEDLGWVVFGTEEGNTAGPVNLNLTTGAVTGKALVVNTGSYLDFNASPYNSNVVADIAEGTFVGYVWSEDIGWLDFGDTGVTLTGMGYVAGAVPEGLAVIVNIENTPVDVSSTPVSGIQTVEIQDSSTSEKIAELDIDFSANISLGNISAGNSATAAFFHSSVPLSTLTNGGSTSYTLYVPKGDGDKVWICPGASSLGGVTLSCSGGYFLSEGQTANGATASVEGTFWKITGLTGTGGMSVITGLTDTLSRLKIATPSDHTITFGTNYGMAVGTGYTMVVEFADFDLSSLAITDIELTDNVGSVKTLAASAGADTWGAVISGNTITFTVPTSGTGGYTASTLIVIKIGLNVTGGANQIINPSSTGSYSETIVLNNTAPGEMGTLNIPIVDSDTVDISGYVTAYINFDIDTNTDNTDCAYNVCLAHGGLGAGTPGNYTVDLGELTSAIVNKSQTSATHSDGLPGTINSIYFDLTTNAPGGAVVTVKSLNGGLQGPGTNLITSVTDGLDIAANSGLYGFNLTTGSTQKHGDLYPNTFCDTETEFCGPTSTPKTVFDTNNLPIDSARVRMDLAAAASYTNNPGVYTDTLTFVATGTF